MKYFFQLSLFIILFFCKQGFSQTCVTLSAATEANEAVAGSTTSWTTLNNSATSNDVRDVSGNLATGGNYTDRLKLTNFGFAIPAGAVIQGISADVERSISTSGSNFTDREIMLVKAGTTQTVTNKATAALWPSTDASVSYGNTTDLWGNTWTPTDINAAGFGIAIAAIRTTNPGSPKNARVDFVNITVCYLILTPLTVKQFTVTKTINASAIINWITTNEQQVKYIQVQKSTNGINFTLFKSVLPTGKNLGTDNEYQVTDNFLLNGITYYRLKIIDENGGFKFSEIKTLNITNSSSRAYINYYNQQINIGIANSIGNYALQVTDITGRLLFSKNIISSGGNELINIPLILNTKQLIVITLKGNNFSLQQKYLSSY